jgi:hypothetical protein
LRLACGNAVGTGDEAVGRQRGLFWRLVGGATVACGSGGRHRRLAADAGQWSIGWRWRGLRLGLNMMMGCGLNVIMGSSGGFGLFGIFGFYSTKPDKPVIISGFQQHNLTK